MRDRRGFVVCLVVFVAARVAFSLVGWLGIRSTIAPPTGEGSDAVVEVAGTGKEVAATPGIHNVVDASLRWDASWYVGIADDGYETSADTAFFPGYVLAIRATNGLSPLGVVGSAVFVSNVAFLLALYLLYRLSEREYDAVVARRTVVLTAFFPTSFFFLAPYAESMYLLCSVIAFTWVRHGRWVAGGLAGAVAWATRSLGAILVPSFVVEAWGRPPRARRLFGAVLPALGFASYVAWSGVSKDDALLPLHAQDVWHRDPAVPIVTLGDGIATGLRALTDAAWLPELGDVVLGLAPLVLLAVAWDRLPSPGYRVYAALGFLVPLSFAVPARPLLSLPRFVIVLFPLAWLGSITASSRRSFTILVTVCALGWGWLSLAFVTWHFVA